MKEITKEWVNKAEKDFAVVLRLLENSDPVFDAVCFHSQQCVEKYLKAVLQENEIYCEKTHDLWLIAQKCLPFISKLNTMKSDLIRLTAYAVEVRYPGFEADKEAAENSLAICTEVRKLVRQYFGLEVAG
ncbi:MAG TPA: HEPN domain-containing protein [Spirochaetota bacterium]|nr:HEPN domain-containing protein [Spirochaetota bacterium]HOF13138.1 HEPN domain-containing protein [Spirochaetota bacterium]HOM87326.1 HEPN domain-containing protein [Spirochaetota bacterium]HOR92479.1 HEPN domain-containing protein [Spirochaetota bacterium]HOT18815.1 HEPN domain-containing protein [Spirochaetota bacterium]